MKISLDINSFLKNSSKIFFSDLTISAILFIQGIFTIRILGPSAYGFWGIIQSFGYTVQSFLSFRTTDVLTKSLVDDPGEDIFQIIGCSFFIDLITNSIVTSTIFFASGALIKKFDYDNLLVVQIFALTFIFNSLNSLWYSLNRNFKNFNSISIFPVLAASIQTGLIILLALTNHLNLLSLAYVILLNSLVQFLYKFFQIDALLKKKYNKNFYTILTILSFKRTIKLQNYFSFMTSTYVASTFSSIVKNGDNLILGLFQPKEVVGFYRVAKSLLMMLLSLGKSLSIVIYQEILEKVKAGKVDEVKRYVVSNTLKNMPLITFLVIGADILAFIMIPGIYGHAYSTSVIPFTIISISSLFSISLFWAQPIVLSIGKHKQYMLIMTLYSFFTVPLLFVSAKFYGLLGFSTVWTITWSLMHVATAFLALNRKNLKSF